MKNLLNFLAHLKYPEYYIVLLGILLAILFSFLLYPKIVDTRNAPVDPDYYGTLAHRLWQNGALSYSDSGPTVFRGPGYPLFLALFLVISPDWWPYSIQVAQAILFGLTSLTVFWIANSLWNKHIALLAALFCAVHPYLIWFTSRIWLETLITFLFTLLIAITLSFRFKPSLLKTFLAGGLLGILALSKQTFFPFIFIVPFFLSFLKTKKIYILSIFLVALAIVLPWSIRNWNLTGKIIPVHILTGYNFQVGDSFVKNFSQSPFGHRELYDLGYEQLNDIAANIQIPTGINNARSEAIIDSAWLNSSLADYFDDPTFFLKKLLFNLWMFWILGDTPGKTLVIAFMQVPLLLLFLLSCIKFVQQEGLRTIQGMHISLVLLYFLFHLPIIAFARLSVVLIPTMIVYGTGLLGYLWQNETQGNTIKRFIDLLRPVLSLPKG